jgi:hypothetical protein
LSVDIVQCTFDVDNDMSIFPFASGLTERERERERERQRERERERRDK